MLWIAIFILYDFGGEYDLEVMVMGTQKAAAVNLVVDMGVSWIILLGLATVQTVYCLAHVGYSMEKWLSHKGYGGLQSERSDSDENTGLRDAIRDGIE